MLLAVQKGAGGIHAPLDGQVLHLSILVVQGLDDTVDCASGYVIVMVEEVGLSVCEDLEQIVKGHEAEVRVSVAELLDETNHGLRRRVRGHARGSHLDGSIDALIGGGGNGLRKTERLRGGRWRVSGKRWL